VLRQVTEVEPLAACATSFQLHLTLPTYERRPSGFRRNDKPRVGLSFNAPPKK
jgi:hypothetical protein